ncbi:MAG: hypothetical protein PHG66_03975 [Candidatus Colwellbacteria bacterium]|nr:hypothetical protein [Candidatus Colwellbacteria bacterium]
MKTFGCSELDCKGIVVMKPENQVIIQTGCRCGDAAFPCNICGRLHWEEDKPVFGRGHNPDKAFFIEGRLMRKPEGGEIIPI